MTLSDIAAGLEVTTEQRQRGVATVDITETALADRLEPVADDLPCSADAAATVIETYATGASVGDCGLEASVAPVTAAKVLHLAGEATTPLSPQGRQFVRDWLSATLSRADALALSGASDAEFALATYCETHDPLAAVCEAAEGALAPTGSASVEKRNALAETMSDSGEFF
ncbi:DUF7858 family protein [Haladaptatus sp. CMSO5]|uniref:DUF7858 family protein n=1 Tax=Haladaptatus sp. CMSO5 TaxID=3120514 RepID=UPI002FCDE781